jgi:DNA repair exonuclease SbcCD nuclease subunit
MFNRLPVPFYTIVGNHDVLSGKLGLLQFSALGSVINIKPDQSIWDDNIPKGKGGIYLIEDELIIDNFHIVGYHWNDPLLQGVFNNYARVEEKFNKTGLIKSNDRVNILVSHSSVGPEKNDYCTAWDELEIDERIDFALFGDIHVGFGPSKLNNGVVVGNPGAFYRGNISEISHKPGFYLIYPNKKIEWHALPQDSDESYFDLDRRLKSLERKRLDFATAKAISTAAKNTDPKDYVRKIGKEANYSDEAINEVLSRLDKVKIKE